MEMTKLRTSLTEVIEKAKGIISANPDGLNGEQEKEVKDLFVKAEGLKNQIDTAQKLNAMSSFLNDPAEPPKAALQGVRMALPHEGDPETDEKSYRTVEVKMPNGEKKEIRFNVPKVSEKKEYKSALNAYLRAAGQKHLLSPQHQKDLSEGIDTAGGFWVGEDWQTEIIKKMATQTIIEQFATVITTQKPQISWPKLVYTADDNYTSAVRMTLTGEVPASSTAHKASNPFAGRHSINVITAMASLPIYQDLLEDADFDIIGLCSQLFGEAFAVGRDNIFINGSTGGEIKGIIYQVDTNDGPESVASGNASALTANGLIDLAYQLPDQYDMNSRFVFQKQTEKAIRKLTDSQNNYLWPVIAQKGNFAPPDRELLGYPTHRDAFVPAIAANAYPIIFGDLRGYYVVNRLGLSIEVLRDSKYAELNQVLILCRQRFGGHLVEPWRIKVQKVAAS